MRTIGSMATPFSLSLSGSPILGAERGRAHDPTHAADRKGDDRLAPDSWQLRHTFAWSPAPT